MRDSYNFYTDKLEGEYRTAFRDIETFGMATNMDTLTFNEKMTEILDILISAQEDGKDVDSVVGKDIESFCENYFSEIPMKTYLYELVDSLKNVAWFILVIDILSIIVSVAYGTPERSDMIALLINFAIIYIVSRLVALLLRKWLFKVKKISAKVRQAIFIIVQIVVFVLVMMLYMTYSHDFGTVSPYAEAIIAAIYLVCYYILNRNRRKAHAMEKKTFYEVVYDHFDEQLVKSYEKHNKKLTKRGKPQLTLEEYIQKLEKEIPMMEKLKYFIIVLPLIITFVAAGMMFATDDFEKTSDILSFIVILLIVEYMMMIPFYKMQKGGTNARKQWIQEYKEKKNNAVTLDQDDSSALTSNI